MFVKHLYHIYIFSGQIDLPEDFCKDDTKTKQIFDNGPYFDLITKVDKVKKSQPDEETEATIELRNVDFKLLPEFEFLYEDEHADPEIVHALLQHIQLGNVVNPSTCFCPE